MRAFIFFIMIKPGEIVHCNLVFLNKKKESIIRRDVVFGRPYAGKFQTIYKIDSTTEDAGLLIRYKIDEDVELISVEVLKSLGFKVDNQNSNYSTASKSETDERQANGSFM